MLNTIIPFRQRVFLANLVFACSLCFLTNCALQKTTQAQTNSNTENGQISKSVNFLDESVDLCRFTSADFLQEKDAKLYDLDKQIYELRNAGFSNEVLIEDAAAIFNKVENCYQTGKKPVPLKAEEIRNAINREVCKNYPQINDAYLCYKRKDSIERDKLPKGSFLFAETGKVQNKNTEEIWLYVEMDKHRRDLVGELIFPFLIRKTASVKNTR